MPFIPVNWNGLDVITSARLNDMANNDVFLKDRKVQGALRNMSAGGAEQDNPKYLKDNLAFLAKYQEFSPGGNFPDSQEQGVGNVKPVFEKKFRFPNNYFDPAFRPVVVCTVGIKSGIRKINWHIKEINTTDFTIAIREFSSLNFTSEMQYFINYIAVGVKQ